MNPGKFYLNGVINILQKIGDQEEKNIEKAAEIVAKKIAEGKMVHVWGTGAHSSMVAEEMLCRKGGLAHVNPILDPGISLSHGAIKEIFGLERVPGYAKVILQYHRLQQGDVMIIGSAYGVNVVTIDAALECKRIDATLIAITSPEYSRSVPLDHPVRHSSKKNLYELADLVINSHVPPGDDIVEIEGFPRKISPVSTIAQVFVINSIVAWTVKKLVEKGISPPVWVSAHEPEGEEANREYMKKYLGRVKSL